MAIQRSNSYPSYSLEECIAVAKEIYSNFGDSIFVSREQIAKILKKAEPTIQTLVSSAVQYGILEMKSKEGYKVSHYYKKIHKPLPDSTEREDALLDCFLTPKLYQDLVQGISEGQHLKQTGLATILFRSHKIAEKVSEKAAQVFIENAAYLGLLDNDGAFHIGAKKDELEKDNGQGGNDNGKNNSGDSGSKNPPLLKDNNKFTAPAGYLSYNWRLKGARHAQIFVPEDFSAEDVETVIKHLDLLKETI